MRIASPQSPCRWSGRSLLRGGPHSDIVNTSSNIRRRARTSAAYPPLRVAGVLRAHSAQIIARWKQLLEHEVMVNPLAPGDLLAGAITASWRAVIARFTQVRRAPDTLISSRDAYQGCGPLRNPYPCHFRAGEQAIEECLRQTSFEAADGSSLGEAIVLTRIIVRQLAVEKANAFCRDCSHRGRCRSCRFFSQTGCGSSSPGAR